MHIPLTGVSTLYLDYIILTVFFFSFLGGLMSFLISGGNLLMLRSYDLRFLSALQEGGIFCYHPVLESLDVLQLLFLLHNPLLFSFFLGFGLCLSPSLLSCMLYIMGLYCLLQTKKELLLFLMPSLHFTVLLLEYFSIMLRNVGGSRGRYYNTEARAKKFLSAYILLT